MSPYLPLGKVLLHLPRVQLPELGLVLREAVEVDGVGGVHAEDGFRGLAQVLGCYSSGVVRLHALIQLKSFAVLKKSEQHS